MYYVKYYIPPPFFFPNQVVQNQPDSPDSPHSPKPISVTNPFLTRTAVTLLPPLSPQPVSPNPLSPHNLKPQSP